ncbi:RHS repeat domain-containing protein [Cystobacter fuscus]|uniref:RHS repeat domain-containing protein n=1 Tax=Cystobacter fuscus TaxID=43 RepID=UPI0037BFCFBA
MIRFAYDALGRRILKTNGRTIWRYGWAGQQLLWEEVERYPGARPIRRDYLFLPDTVIPLAFREEGRTYWLQSDARGAIIRAFDEAGRIVWNSSYDSFGTARVELELVRQPWRLAGQYEDEETGLHYNLARYYCPWLKSYLSRDPRWYEPEATGYSYCRNDPWNRADPFGGLAPLLAVGIAGLVGAAVGAITAAAMGGDPIAGAVGGAIAGAGSIIAVVAGASAGVILAAGVVATGVGALAESLVEQANSGDGFCLQCALASAAAAALTDLALFGLGKVPGVRRLAQVVAKRLSHFGSQAKQWGGKLFSSLLLRLVRTRASPPFSKPWSQMTNAERKAFQHAYSRHGADFNLPNWSQSKAEQLRQQFNQAVEGVRTRAQSAFITKKPFGVKGSGKTGDSKYMIFLRHTDGSGTSYYYYETLMGRFVSSGLNRP